MLSSIQRRHGRLDIAINNAGVASMNHTLLTPAATVDRIMGTNFRGTFLICRESAKLMQRRRYGRIVNLSTVAVPMRLEGEAIYAASKQAVVTLTQIMARELADFGITCNAVGPTPIETDLIHAVPAEKIQRIIDSLAIKRLGRFEDVANVIDFFVQPASDYITGQVIYLGGA
jgi:3-oxoacyl-[acyl-carrier protein] reductase